MAEKYFIDQSDHLRALLTEVLPYETLFPFSNAHFYRSMVGAGQNFDKQLPVFLRAILKMKKEAYTIPYDYQILRDVQSTRKLSIVHPSKQLDMCKFYKEYDDLIIHHCNKSPFSIRRPSRITGWLYLHEKENDSTDSEADDDDVSSVPEAFQLENARYQNYFGYSRYTLLYKFFDSWEFLGLERQFSNYDALDVSKCFYNIYSHSICWAVRDKETSKKNRSGTFESKFDSLMQKANYDETNGIVVGPEISRIFAEILLQSVDVEIESELAALGLNSREHYWIARYIDDYFVFTGNDKDRAKVINQIEMVLARYKLYLNTSKKVSLSRPFSEPVARAKSGCKLAIDTYKQALSGSESSSSQTNRFHVLYLNLINSLKVAIKSNEAKFSDVSRYVLKPITVASIRYLREEKNLSFDASKGFVLKTLDALFYIYQMDQCYRTTNTLSRFFYELLSATKVQELGLGQEVVQAFYIHCTRLFHEKVISNQSLSMEDFNLILVLGEYRDEVPVPADSLEEWYGHSTRFNSDEICYHREICYLSYIKDSAVYSVLRGRIVTEAISYFQNSFQIESANDCLLLIDLIACPWIGEKDKKKIAKAAVEGCQFAQKDDTLNKTAKKFVHYVSGKKWFFDWEVDGGLSSLLNRKERSHPYAN